MRIVLRVDAGGSVGYGHLKRCLVLASELRKRGHHCHFLFRGEVAGLERVITKSAFEYTLIAHGNSLAEETGFYPKDANVVILDLCHAGIMNRLHDLKSLIESLKRMGRKIVIIDSMNDHAFTIECDPSPDLVITPYLGAETQTRPPCRQWLAGSSYAILADGYSVKAHSETSEEPLNVLISTGGGDPHNLTSMIFSMLCLVTDEPFRCRVILGPLFPDVYQAQLKYLGQSMPYQVEWIESPDDLLDQLRWADLLVGTAGLIRYEAAALGLPALLIAPENHYQPYYERFNTGKLARILFMQDPQFEEALLRETRCLIGSREARAELASQGPAHIDNEGCSRVADAIEQLSGAQ